jgi:hypothetical protein
MHGKGRFWDPRLNDAATLSSGGQDGFGNLNPTLSPEEDRGTAKLSAIRRSVHVPAGLRPKRFDMTLLTL